MAAYDTEKGILDNALLAVEREAGLLLRVDNREVRENQDLGIDALLRLQGQRGTLAAEVKRYAQHANLGALIQQVKRLPPPALLVADYVNPKMADKLRAADVQFMDTAGNAYINQPPVYVFVNGLKPDPNQTTGKAANRAFDTAGLKIIFALLCEPALAAAPYRRIADRADVALGTVTHVISDLTESGFIFNRGTKNDRRLVNRRKLFHRWVEVYPERLKPRLRLGDFVADDHAWWRNFDINEYGAYWGGEVAAAGYTDYLIPEVVTIYIFPEAIQEKADTRLLADAKLRKRYATEGPGVVHIYRAFWSMGRDYPGYTHPVLTYADLVGTGDQRNLEAADIIYDKYLAGYLGEA